MHTCVHVPSLRHHWPVWHQVPCPPGLTLALPALLALLPLMSELGGCCCGTRLVDSMSAFNHLVYNQHCCVRALCALCALSALWAWCFCSCERRKGATSADAPPNHHSTAALGATCGRTIGAAAECHRRHKGKQRRLRGCLRGDGRGDQRPTLLNYHHRGGLRAPFASSTSCTMNFVVVSL